MLSSNHLDRVPLQIQADLALLLRKSALRLPERFRQTRDDRYARRLLYRDPEERYTVVAMAWEVCQCTPVHDHAGIWCVEGVLEGEIEVTQYRIEHVREDAFLFERQDVIRAGVGSTGSLIPPFEYHRLCNATDRPAITVHIYGGEIRECSAYFPQPNGTYRREMRALSYDD